VTTWQDAPVVRVSALSKPMSVYRFVGAVFTDLDTPVSEFRPETFSSS
jgi:hypothetical protein